MALNPNLAREQDRRILDAVHTRTFLVVAAALPGLAVAKTLVDGAVMGAAVAVSIVCAAVICRLVPRFTGLVARIPVALMLNLAMAVLVSFAVRVVAPVTHQALGIYLVLASGSGMAALLAAELNLPEGAPRFSVADIATAAVAAVAVLVVCGCVTELLSTGQVLGLTVAPLATSPIAVFGKPAGSLLILALVAALVQATERSSDSAAPAADGKEGGRA